MKILNSIIELEAIPDIFKCGYITPVYKESGKDPLDKSNYRGITVASVLAKVLEFLILERLNKLESASLGLKINDLFIGGFAHADDIRTITNSTSSLNAQLEAVSSFTSENFLQLNPSKCEIVSFSRQSRSSQPQLSLDGAIIPCNDGAKCLGYVWSSTLSSKPMIEHNVTKARKSYFAFGSIGVYQGAISPLSCRSLVETCVMPILLYGCENWSLCYSSLKILN